MNTDKSTAEIATLKPAKKAGKSPLEKLQAKFDKKVDDLATAVEELNAETAAHSESLLTIRLLEAQLRNKSEASASAGYDTQRNANALILIDNYLEDASDDDEKTVPVSRLTRISKQLTKDLTPAALQIQAH